MSVSSVKNNGYNYLNNNFNNGSALGSLISGSVRNGSNGSSANTNNNLGPNLDLKQQVSDTCDSFEVSCDTYFKTRTIFLDI